MRSVISVDDLTDDQLTTVLDDARRLSRHGAAAMGRRRQDPFVVALLFLTPSLRTRAGYAVAALRLGGACHDIVEARWAADMSAPETFDDTLRTVSGMVDVVVTRTPFPLDRNLTRHSQCPIINGGDGSAEHPTQALIDLLAIEEERGPIAEQRVMISGDLDARSVHSLVRLLERRPPRSLVLTGPRARTRPPSLGPRLATVTETADAPDFRHADVVYLAGLPQGIGPDTLHASVRASFALDADKLHDLAPDAVVLSPMPVVDEISPDARSDGRIRMFEQSDRGVFVRMAVLQMVLGDRHRA